MNGSIHTSLDMSDTDHADKQHRSHPRTSASWTLRSRCTLVLCLCVFPGSSSRFAGQYHAKQSLHRFRSRCDKVLMMCVRVVLVLCLQDDTFDRTIAEMRAQRAAAEEKKAAKAAAKQ